MWRVRCHKRSLRFAKKAGKGAFGDEAEDGTVMLQDKEGLNHLRNDVLELD